MNKLDMQTRNIADENYATLAKLFPNALTEKIVGYDEEGKAIIERAIDVDVLRQEISCSVVEGREESVNFSETENLYIEGDNLDVLKLLQETYLGKVKAIYKVFSVADGFLMACFDSNVTEEVVKAVAQEKSDYAVFRDSSMANDSVATNFEQIFATYSPETVRKVL